MTHPLGREASRHQPFERNHGSKTRVVFVHGYAGSPDQFHGLAEQLYGDGCDVAAILLPGHGGDSHEFNRDWDQAWQRHVWQSVERLREGYDRVFLIGHSLGGLLCLEYAADRPVDGVVTISAPLGVRFSLFQIAFSMELLFSGPDRGRPIARAYSRGFGVRMKGPFSPLSFILPGISVLKSIRRIRKRLPEVRTPVLVVQSRKDETVTRSSADRLAATLGGPVRLVRLTRSRHAYLVPQEEAKVWQEIRDLMKILARPAPDQVSFS